MKKSVLVVIVAALANLGTASAASWRVEQDGSGDFLALQPAVDASATGDTIFIGPGWYQELNWVDHFGSPIEVAAYWTDDKDLYFIGTSAAEVKVGPPNYVRYLDGPQGVYQEGLFRNKLFVSDVTFVNLYIGAHSFGTISVERCIFDTGGIGVTGNQGEDCFVRNSTFANLTNGSCNFFSCVSANVENCVLGADVYFGGVDSGNIRNCTGEGRQLVYYFQSSGEVDNNDMTCMGDPCIVVDEGGSVEIRNNQLKGGSIGLTVAGSNTYVNLENNTIESPDLHNIQIFTGATLVATGNDFIKANGTGNYFVRINSYPGGAAPTVISMENNYWADELTGPFVSAFQIGFHIWDFNDDPSQKAIIDFDPFSTQPVPLEKQSFGSFKSMFR
jgi:hypothetical protein